MVKPHTRRIYLKPLTEGDISLLWKWRNEQPFRDFCSYRKGVVTLDEFREELDGDFSLDRHEQYLIYRRRNDEPIGTIFSYDFDQVNGHVFITTYLSDGNQGGGYGPEAFLLFAVHLVEVYDLFKIYTEVYDYNGLSLKTMLKGGFVEEGRFRGHRLYQERRCDLIRLAVYRSDVSRAINLILRLGGEEET